MDADELISNERLSWLLPRVSRCVEEKEGQLLEGKGGF